LGRTPFLVLSTAEFPVNSPWTEFTATVVATGASTVLRFDHLDAPSWTMVDDISVRAVPESAQWLLMLAGLGALARVRLCEQLSSAWTGRGRLSAGAGYVSTRLDTGY
jgi:hypothetical protein